MGNEAHFHFVNKQNMRFWCTENPQIDHATKLHTRKVIVWCGVTSERIIGPYFLEDPDENAVTVTGE